MFNKVLIANRGEIACRVIGTCRRLGIGTVAVYSDADADAKHVSLADEAWRIGEAPAQDSYLRGDVIIKAAVASRADAIHPGYGFLSENPDFAEAVAAAGLIFVGPPAGAIRAMGLKDAAKTRMTDAGVPVVPGYHGDNQDPAFLQQRADEIGYPVLIKARAGGGGKGMRKVAQAKEFVAALEGAQREARSSFDDDRVLIEKWVNTPRHIEIQVFADNHGNAVHLFERDCSLQRRHQKVIEEAPAPGMTDEMRTAMGEAAVKAAKTIGYSGAGTVEFIVDSSEGLSAQRFYFMEMNTRLQVEHPVTECITGEDLVEWQLRIADDETLPKQQSQLMINGWAFEARIYAEDVDKGFLPASGRLQHLELPTSLARVDSGVRQGDDVSRYYDPMIAKVTVHGVDRNAALNKLRRALASTRVVGPITNVAFLAALTEHEGFARGDVDTGLIERDLDQLLDAQPPDEKMLSLAAIAALELGSRSQRDGSWHDPWHALVGWRLWTTAQHSVVLMHQDLRYDLVIHIPQADVFEVHHGERTTAVRLIETRDRSWRVAVDGYTDTATIVSDSESVTVFFATQRYTFHLPERVRAHSEGEAGGDQLVAPIPGAISAIATAAGAAVAQGDALIVMEAMKMEHTLSAPRDGVVAEILVKEGEQVDENAVLLTLEVTD